MCGTSARHLFPARNHVASRCVPCTDALAGNVPGRRRWCPHAAYVAFAALAAPSIRSRSARPRRMPLAEIVEYGGQQHPAVIRIDEHAEPQVIRAVQRLRIEMRDRVCFRERRDVDVTRVGVMVRKTRMQLLTGHAGRKQAQLDRHGEHDACR